MATVWRLAPPPANHRGLAGRWRQQQRLDIIDARRRQLELATTTHNLPREDTHTGHRDGAHCKPRRQNHRPADPGQDRIIPAKLDHPNLPALACDRIARALGSETGRPLTAGFALRPIMKELAPPKTLDRFFSDLARARARLLVLDYDGTLAPFAMRREDAQLYPGVAPLLETAISRGTEIAFITGRPARELADRLPFSGIEIFGAHGYEHLEANGALVQRPLPAPIEAALSDMDQMVATSGYAHARERKHGMLAIHWRHEEAGTRRALEELGARLQGRLPAGMQALSFDGGLEFRAMDHHKGTALAELLARHPNAQVAYLGDDTTDEDAFAALPPEGLGVLVRPELRDTQAHIWLKPPEELREFLLQWATLAPCHGPGRAY